MKSNKPLIRRTFLQERFDILIKKQRLGEANFNDLTELDDIVNRDPAIRESILEEMHGIDNPPDEPGQPEATTVEKVKTPGLLERLKAFINRIFISATADIIAAVRKYMKKYTLLFAIAYLAVTALFAFRIAGHKQINIVFIGDSITQGSNNPALQPSVYTLSYLKDKLPQTIIKQANAGVSGRTTLDFLPGEPNYQKATDAADTLYKEDDAELLFSIMLGTNDSAIKGPHGAPVTVATYNSNLKTIVDSLLHRYPQSKIVIHHPVWYSPNTYNGSMYLAEGLARLQTYFAEIDGLVKRYKVAHPGHVFVGDKAGFDYFKQHYTNTLRSEEGHQGTFFTCTPNEQGAARLGELWGKAIYKALK